LEHVLTDQQADMVKELEHQVMRCVKDQNGNHVIQKAIERVPTVHIRFIVNDFKGQISRLAAHPYGCRVIQRMLEHCEESDKQSILAELHACTASLIPDQFGNYVIQHVIQNGDERDRSRIISIVMLQLLSFSKHKFASNVVEKSVEYGSAVQRSEILNLLITPNERGESPLFGLMRDQYGNYVIRTSIIPLLLAFANANPSHPVVEKVLEQSKGTHRGALIRQIDPLLGQLKKMSYGKQIAAIERLIYHSPGGEAISPAFTAAKTGPGGSPAPLSTDSEGASSSDETNVTPTSPAIDTPSSRSSSLPSTNTSIIECPTE
jgi:mRNA-binding protein PUF3